MGRVHIPNARFAFSKWTAFNLYAGPRPRYLLPTRVCPSLAPVDPTRDRLSHPLPPQPRGNASKAAVVRIGFYLRHTSESVASTLILQVLEPFPCGYSAQFATRGSTCESSDARKTWVGFKVRCLEAQWFASTVSHFSRDVAGWMRCFVLWICNEWAVGRGSSLSSWPSRPSLPSEAFNPVN